MTSKGLKYSVGIAVFVIYGSLVAGVLLKYFLPSQAGRNRAARHIEHMQPCTDAERINWLEKMKSGRFGIGYDGYKYVVRIDLAGRAYFGRTFREAIDNGIKGE